VRLAPHLAPACAVLVLVACGPRPAADSLPRSAPVGAYAALRWVPADATYVVAARRTEDALAVARAAIDVIGLAADVDADEVGRALRSELGIDLLSVAGLVEAGVDPAGGAALFSQGLSPTLALPLADPAGATALIDRLRKNGVTVQSERRGGVERFIYGGPDVRLEWAIADRWLWLHLDVTAEHAADGAWLAASRAAGGALAVHADWRAALDVGSRRLGTPADGAPVAGLVRTHALLDRAVAVGAPAACVAPARRAGRLFLAARAGDDGAATAVVAELGDAAGDVAALALPSMPGWAAARAGAPLQAEWSADLARVAAGVAACDGGELARAQRRLSLRAARVFVHAIDVADLSGKGAVHLDVGDRAPIAAMLDDMIPGRRWIERSRQVGPFAGGQIAVPMLPAFTYVLTGALFVAGVGVDLVAVVGSGRPTPSPALGRVELHPASFPPATWDMLLEPYERGAEARARLVQRLQRWKVAEIGLAVDGGELLLTARGELRAGAARHRP